MKYAGNLGEEKPEERSKAIAEAEGFFNKALGLKADYAPAHFQLARIYLEQGKEEEVIASLQKAKEAAPRDVGLAFQLGVLYYNINNLDTAQKEFERALTLNPDYANAKYLLGLVYSRNGDTARALEEFEAVAELNPGNQEIQQIITNLKQGKSALAHIQEQTALEELPEELPIEERPEEK